MKLADKKLHKFQTVQLRKVVGKAKTWNPIRDAADAVFTYIDLSSIDQASKTIVQTTRVIGRSAPSRARQIVKSGDVLVATVRPNLNGVAHVMDELDDATASTGFCVLRPEPGMLDGNFLFHWVKTPDFVSDLARKSTGASYPAVSDRIILDSYIPLPPLPDQKRIAAILDSADALRAKRRESLALLDDLLQSTFLHMFGDPVTNPMGWPTSQLPNLVAAQKYSLKRGPFGGALKKEIFISHGHKVYEQQNVINDDFQLGTYHIGDQDFERLRAFAVIPGDLLVSCSGTIGRIAVLPQTACSGVMNQALLKIRLDQNQVLNSFFISLWRSQPFERQVLGMTHGTGLKNMKSMDELKSIRFIVPPSTHQQHFVSIVESVEQQKARMRAHLAELDTLFASLQSRAFNGEL